MDICGYEDISDNLNKYKYIFFRQIQDNLAPNCNICLVGIKTFVIEGEILCEVSEKR